MPIGHAADDTDEDDLTPDCPGPDPTPRRPRLAIPAQACDSHAHIIGPLSLFELDPARRCTPPEAPLASWCQMLDRLGLRRGVLVQPDIFGNNNDCMLQALARHRNKLRGIATVSPGIGDDALAQLATTSIRGLRVALSGPGALTLSEIEILAQRIQPLGWHLELGPDLSLLPHLATRLSHLPVELVLEHLGGIRPAAGPGQPGLEAVLTLLARGRCWVKLSGFDRLTASLPPYPDLAPYIATLVDAEPTQLIWGSDWPHIGITGIVANDADRLDALARAVPDERHRHLILVENPARLYGFDGF